MNISPQYLAGVIDSDGSISITKRHLKRPKPNYSVMIQIGWVFKPESENFMKMMVQKYGGSYSLIEPRGTTYSKRKHIKYCAYASNAILILNDIKDYLLLKKGQANNALNVQSIIDSYSGQPRSDEKGEQLEELYKNNLILNDKNGYSNG